MSNRAMELVNITKAFGNVIANDNISMTVEKGEVLAILGENGSGKTTLMNMIAGIYFPDDGKIFIDGKEVVITSPADAHRLQIGMIHQHFKLIDVFSATENIVLGLEDETYDLGESAKKIRDIAERYGFHIEPDKKIYNMSVSEKQTVEIIRVLYRGANILILDEPTAVLTPQETDRLFEVLRRMRDDGKSIIIITHKLSEVMAISDRVTVLRKGQYIDTVETEKTNPQLLTEMMVGETISLNIERKEPEGAQDRLIVDHVTVKGIQGDILLDDVSFAVKSGEILGIAGIAGSGQKELLEAIAGLQEIDDGKILYRDTVSQEETNLIHKDPMEIRDLGVRLSFVPEDRLGMGLVGNMNIVDNIMLRSYQAGSSVFVEREAPRTLAERIIERLEVATESVDTQVSKLSGGNVQKILVGREIASHPTVFMAAYPVRGLDINSSYKIYDLLNEQKELGVAVIFVGEDLDVLLALCDRILVLSHGKLYGPFDGRNISKEEIGFNMVKGREETDGKRTK